MCRRRTNAVQASATSANGTVMRQRLNAPTNTMSHSTNIASIMRASVAAGARGYA